MPLTDQTFFDQAAEHSAEQGQRSVAANEVVCLYFDEKSGRTCPIGKFIVDAGLYRSEMEAGVTITDLLDEFDDVAELFAGVSRSLLFDVQDVHDDQEEEEWLSALWSIASDHKLDRTALLAADWSQQNVAHLYESMSGNTLCRGRIIDHGEHDLGRYDDIAALAYIRQATA